MRQPIVSVALLASGLFSTFGSAAPHGLVPTDDTPNSQPPSIGTTDQRIIELDPSPSPNLQVINSNQGGANGPIRGHSQVSKSIKKRGGIFGSIVESIANIATSIADDKTPVDAMAAGVRDSLVPIKPIKPIPEYFLPKKITEIWDPPLGPGAVTHPIAERIKLAQKLYNEINGQQTKPKPTDGSPRGPSRGADKSKGSPDDAANGRPRSADPDLAEQVKEFVARPVTTQADIARGRILANAVRNKKYADSTRRRTRPFVPGNVGPRRRRRSTGSPEKREALSRDILEGGTDVVVDSSSSVEEAAQQH